MLWYVSGPAALPTYLNFLSAFGVPASHEVSTRRNENENVRQEYYLDDLLS